MKIKKMLSVILCVILATVIITPMNSMAVIISPDENFDLIYELQILDSREYEVSEDGWRYSNSEGEYFVVGYEGTLESATVPTEINGKDIVHIFLKDAPLKEVIVPDNSNFESIVFYGSKNLIFVELPSNIKSISPYAFYDCVNLKNIELPESIESIGRSAFANSGIETIIIPESCEDFGYGVFEDAKSLQKVVMNSKQIDFEFLGIEDWGRNRDYIPDNMFKNCPSLKSIKLPESVKSIGESAFAYSGLTSITIPKNVKTIYKDAFKGCENLTSVKFAGNVNNIGRSAFSKCVNLKTVNFTKGYLKKIYDYAFYKCESLEKITISNTKNVPTIAKSAFNKAKSGIKFYVKNNTVAKKLKGNLQKTNIKKAKIYRSAPILLYKNVG